MTLFSDYCETSLSQQLNIVEYKDKRFYLLPDYLEWYSQDINLPVVKYIEPKRNKVLEYDFGKTEFDQLLVVVTNRCNIVCDYCFRGYNFSKIKEISFNDFKSVADHFLANSKYQPTVQFSGGEVFVKEGIEDWFEYLDERGFRIWMTTNGVHKKIAQSKKVRDIFSGNHKHHIRISLDGSRPEIHERYRQKGTFVKIIETMKYLKSIDASVSAKSVVTKENIHFLEEMLEMCYDLGLYGWNYNVIRYTGAMADTPPEDSTPKAEEQIEYFGYYELGLKLVEILERKPHLAPLLRISRFGKILDTLFNSTPHSVPMSYYILRFDGNVYYNDNLQVDEYSPGNIWQEGTNAFNGLKNFRKSFDYDLPACNRCPIHRFCFQKGDYGELHAKDPSLQADFPNCDDIRQHYFHIMSLGVRGVKLHQNMFN